MSIFSFGSKKKKRQELEEAIQSGNVELVKQILQNGINPNYYLWFNGIGQPLLLSAIMDFFNIPVGYKEKVPIEIIKLLLDAGADPKIGDTKNGYTPLMWVADKGNKEIIDLLNMYV